MYESANYFHLNRLFVLRNIAIAAQFLAVFVTHHLLEIPLPLIAIALIIFQIILFNSFVWIRLRQAKPVTENEIFIHLAFDVLALAILLYFTGGASNPFVMLFLFPLTITVTILPIRYAWLLVALSVACYSLLMFYYQPLPIGHDMGHDMGQSMTQEMTHAMGDHSNHDMHEPVVSSEYNLHLTGMWLAFIINACLITYYVYGMGSTLRRQQKQLSTAREQSIRDEQLVVLGTLAASTAHELGTPLGTMALLVSELEADIPNQSTQVNNDLKNLKEQINRCKISLSDLSASVGASSDLHGGSIDNAADYFSNIKNEILLIRPDSNISYDWQVLDSNATVFIDRTLTLALINVIENAIDVSPEFTKWIIKSETDSIQFEILDQGPGLSEAALASIGEKPYSEKELGLGLGLYLAYAAIRRRGGSIQQSNRKSIGSRTLITLPTANKS